jgi:teichuronic acid biosynthesis glycosyltransferase TuaG
MSLLEELAPVSAVIPCYRCCGTIREAVESIAAQTARPREVILVDDCSADGTAEELKRVASEYPPGWIRVLALPRNGGPGYARNAGWDIATQPYIAFLDADDAWHEKKIEIQYGWMRTNPRVVLTGHPSVRVRRGSAPVVRLATMRVSRVIRLRLLLSNCFSSRSIMVRRDLATRFHASKRHMEDHWWLLQVVFSGHSIYKIDMPLAYVFKPVYGQGGLSGDLWLMEKGELSNYWGLWQEKRIALVTVLFLSCYSLLKYAKRVLVSAFAR